ncbi:KilA-N domain-containing protein [Paenibacillus taiwanensis]|uniref:KilA-N domain-containing protein n=1 Tax=Paenibacillus taiwanensis TaxID=401638 RepID=UPI00041220B4|nr:KilA-N domain-containing protein [Paenibacillus taiwanensis]
MRNIKVPYGYEPEKALYKGTLIYYDSFEHTSDIQLDLAVQQAEQRSFAKLVLYPLHEQSVKRMYAEPVSAYYKREDRLHEWKRNRGYREVAIEGWEGKRKKYTPVDTALQHLMDSYQGPYFLYVTPDMANLLASYASFENWIVKVRLLLSQEPDVIHPRLTQYRQRWDWAGENTTK